MTAITKEEANKPLNDGESRYILHLTTPEFKAIEAIGVERDFQDKKFGPNSQHTIGEWILIMEAELDEAKRALIKGGTGRDSVLMEIVQVCAVGLACLEQHGVTEVGRMQPIMDFSDAGYRPGEREFQRESGL